MATTTAADNTLYYGDNLDIMREYIPTASVDLVYLDPPFNSNRNYNVLLALPIMCRLPLKSRLHRQFDYKVGGR